MWQRLACIGFVAWTLAGQDFNAQAETAHRASARPEPSVDASKDSQPKPDGAKAKPSNDIDRYCANVAASATEAANAIREQELRALEQKIEQRIRELDAKRVDVQHLIENSEAILAKADDSLVALYSKMKPDNAANQIAKLDDDVAIALLMRVRTKELSAIMDEMDAERAASLAKKLSQKLRRGNEKRSN